MSNEIALDFVARLTRQEFQLRCGLDPFGDDRKIKTAAEFYERVFGWKTRTRGDGSIAFDLLASADTPVRSFRAGEVIFNEGDPAQESYVIQKGQVEIRRNGRLLDTLPEKSIFGEMALIDHAPRAATAVAATDVVLVPVAEKQFLFLVSQTPYFALNVMRVLARRLRSANGAI